MNSGRASCGEDGQRAGLPALVGDVAAGLAAVFSASSCDALFFRARMQSYLIESFECGERRRKKRGVLVATLRLSPSRRIRLA